MVRYLKEKRRRLISCTHYLQGFYAWNRSYGILHPYILSMATMKAAKLVSKEFTRRISLGLDGKSYSPWSPTP
jgi:hypothetical protein